MFKKHIQAVTIVGLFISCSTGSNQNQQSIPESNGSTVEIKLSSDIVWEKLNPARGDKSPQAGTIWGDRKGTAATGFLAKFIDGFSSPPHIHNVTYRAVVIHGAIHNDDPGAANMWMGPGSFWTQPKGEPHITSAKGEENVAYVEIDSGPYLVRPVREAFDKGERPVNIDASNILWLNADKSEWIDDQSKAELSFLWKRKDDSNLMGLFVKFPSGFSGTLKTSGSIMKAIVIQGNVDYSMPSSQEIRGLDAGSMFSSSAKEEHKLHTSIESILYIRTNGQIQISDN